MSSTPDTVSIATGHGVAVGHALAGLGARSYAFIVDWHIRFLLAVAWLLAYFALDWCLEYFGTGLGLERGFVWLGTAPAAALYFLYHPLYEVLTNGSTPGKRMSGIRVVSRDGRYAHTGAHLTRNLFRLIDALPILYCVGVVCCLLNRQQLRIGDYAAGTVLVYDEHDSRGLHRAIHHHTARGPYGAEQLALVADLVARWPALAAPRRQALALSVLSSLGKVTAPAPDDAALLLHLQDVLDTAGRD